LCCILHFIKWFTPAGRDDGRAALIPDESWTSIYKTSLEETGNGCRAQYYNQDIPCFDTDVEDMGGSKAAPGASWEGFGDFPLNPHEKLTSLRRPRNNLFESIRLNYLEIS
jgi:hypothetical protein